MSFEGERPEPFTSNMFKEQLVSLPPTGSQNNSHWWSKVPCFDPLFSTDKISKTIFFSPWPSVTYKYGIFILKNIWTFANYLIVYKDCLKHKKYRQYLPESLRESAWWSSARLTVFTALEHNLHKGSNNKQSLLVYKGHSQISWLFQNF